MAWVPGHNKIHDNEMADKLAKIDRELNIPMNIKMDIRTNLPNIKTNINSGFKKHWLDVSTLSDNNIKIIYKGLFQNTLCAIKFLL